MKKIIYLVLCFAIIFSLAACNNGKNNTVKDSNVGTNKTFEINTNEDASKILINSNWKCVSLATKDTKEDIPMESVYGSALQTNQGMLLFYEDGVFKNLLPGIMDEEISPNGIYSINKDTIALTYDDGRKEEGKILSNTTLEIVTDGFVMKFSAVNK